MSLAHGWSCSRDLDTTSWLSPSERQQWRTYRWMRPTLPFRLHPLNLLTSACASSLAATTEGQAMWGNRSSETEDVTGRLSTLLLFFVPLSPHSRRLGGEEGAGLGVASLAGELPVCRQLPRRASTDEPGDFVTYCCWFPDYWLYRWARKHYTCFDNGNSCVLGI